VEVYREQLGPDGKTLMYRLPAEGGATPGTPASLDDKPILEPYAALEVSGAHINTAFWKGICIGKLHVGLR
jgi:hypothetical protein